MLSMESIIEAYTWNIDPVTKYFSFYQGFPVFSVLIVISSLIATKLLLPLWMSTQSTSYDTRPGMFMINGIDFGISVCGSLLIYFSSPTPAVGFNCVPLSATDFRHIAYRYAGIAYFFVLLTGLGRPMLRVLRHQSKGVNALTVQSIFLPFYIYYILFWECTEAALFLPFVETAVGSLRAGYFILTISTDNNPTKYSNFRRIVVTAQIFKGFALIAHVTALFFHPTCSNYHGIKTLETIYGLGHIYYGLANLRNQVNPVESKKVL